MLYKLAKFNLDSGEEGKMATSNFLKITIIFPFVSHPSFTANFHCKIKWLLKRGSIAIWPPQMLILQELL